MEKSQVKAIRDAISREKDAYRLYIGLMKSASDQNQESFFRTLALQEIKHETLLGELMRTDDIHAAKDKLRSRYYNEEINILDNLNERIDTVGLDEGFDRAISEEQNAQRIYSKLIDSADDEDLKGLFRTILAEEVSHEKLLRKEKERFLS